MGVVKRIRNGRKLLAMKKFLYDYCIWKLSLSYPFHNLFYFSYYLPKLKFFILSFFSKREVDDKIGTNFNVSTFHHILLNYNQREQQYNSTCLQF